MSNNNNKRGGFNMSLLVQDENWNKMADFKWNTANKKKQNYIIRSLDDAFGIKLIEKSDIDWAKL